MYYIDANIECHKPEITIRDRNTQDTIAHFNKKETSELFDAGELTVCELQSTDSHSQNSLIEELLVIYCHYCLLRQLEKEYLELSLRREANVVSIYSASNTGCCRI